ncbi:MAG: type II toxin-antitoxin system ParD family antitoxin [Acidobacteria bacterium]|nr:MAG: type II toxin-antitoxin system ParD family antitoxin [Acidobacteriota bacterium]
MGTVRKTITLTEKQDEWVKAQIANGDYTNDSEYFRDLVRRHQEQDAKSKTLKDAILEGLESGVREKTVGELWAEAEARYKTREG